MTVRNLPLVGFLGLDANRGPVRYKNCTENDVTDDDIRTMRQNTWTQELKRPLELRLGRTLPESVDKLSKEDLQEMLTRGGFSDESKSLYVEYLTGDLEYARLHYCFLLNTQYKKARSLFDSDLTIRSIFPILNLISGIGKIIAGITSDGKAYSVIEEDRGWKFRATVIAVGIAEICFLGLIVHGIATIYFAMTSLEAQPAPS